MSWWNNLNSRERMLIGMGLPLLFMLTLFVTLWQPTFAKRSQLREAVPESRALLAWMQHQLSHFDVSIKSTSDGAPVKPLLTVIEQTAISTQISDTIQRVQPSNAGTVEIWFQETKGDQLLEWIDQLASRGIGVDSATITRATQGLVTARIKLSRG